MLSVLLCGANNTMWTKDTAHAWGSVPHPPQWLKQSLLPLSVSFLEFRFFWRLGFHLPPSALCPAEQAANLQVLWSCCSVLKQKTKAKKKKSLLQFVNFPAGRHKPSAFVKVAISKVLKWWRKRLKREREKQTEGRGEARRKGRKVGGKPGQAGPSAFQERGFFNRSAYTSQDMLCADPPRPEDAKHFKSRNNWASPRRCSYSDGY